MSNSIGYADGIRRTSVPVTSSQLNAHVQLHFALTERSCTPLSHGSVSSPQDPNATTTYERFVHVWVKKDPKIGCAQRKRTDTKSGDDRSKMRRGRLHGEEGSDGMEVINSNKRSDQRQSPARKQRLGTDAHLSRSVCSCTKAR